MTEETKTHGITTETRAINTEYSNKTRENKKTESICDPKAGISACERYQMAQCVALQP
jgi:hypothetical protein